MTTNRETTYEINTDDPKGLLQFNYMLMSLLSKVVKTCDTIVECEGVSMEEVSTLLSAMSLGISQAITEAISMCGTEIDINDPDTAERLKEAEKSGNLKRFSDLASTPDIKSEPEVKGGSMSYHMPGSSAVN